MSNILWKNIYLCFPKFSCPTATPPPPPSSLSHQDHSHPPPPTQLTTSTLITKNLNSICSDLTSEAEHSTSKSLTSSSDFFSSSDESELAASPPDFATIFASQRFFFSSPGRSNSIIDSSSTATTPEPDTLGTGGVAIQTYSPEPYVDFRRSMQEMVEARQIVDVEGDWDYLYELLVCYLTLNPKHIHKYIVAAFADLLISLMPSNTTDSHGQNPESYRRSAVSQLLL